MLPPPSAADFHPLFMGRCTKNLAISKQRKFYKLVIKVTDNFHFWLKAECG
jgi:hypothetical protein